MPPRRNAALATRRSTARGSDRVPWRASAWAVWLAAALVAAVAILVYRGVLPYFFAQDDFEGLARARGLVPRLDGVWRLIGNQAYYDAMAPLAGLDPFGYRLASLLLHAATSVLVMFVLRRVVSPPAAFLGAVFFAAHPTLYTSLYWIAAVSSILALAFALAAVWIEGGRGALRWLALPLFVLSLLSKETTLGLPLVIAATRIFDGRGLRDGLLIALVAVAVGFAWALAASGPVALGVERGPDAAYHVSAGAHVLTNAANYLGWSVDSWVPTMRGFTDAVDPQAVLTGTVAFGVWLVGLLVRDLRRRGWWLGAAWFLALIAPVLPLMNHAYHYYLYGPLVGVALWLGVTWDSITAAIRPRAVAVAALWVVVALVTVNGMVLVRRIETEPFMGELRADPSVDRAIIARNVWRDLGLAGLPEGAALRFWSPTAMQIQAEARPDADVLRESYWERNVRTALLDGLGVRVLFPEVREVSFVRDLDLADSALYAVYRIDGSLRVATPAALDSLIAIHGGSPTN